MDLGEKITISVFKMSTGHPSCNGQQAADEGRRMREIQKKGGGGRGRRKRGGGKERWGREKVGRDRGGREREKERRGGERESERERLVSHLHKGN